MPRKPAQPGAKRQPVLVDTPSITDTPSLSAISDDTVSVINLDLAPLPAAVVLWSKSGRVTAALMHSRHIARLQADLDELSEAFVANHLSRCIPSAHWFLVPVQGSGSSSAEAVANLRARVTLTLEDRARTDGGAMARLARSFADKQWSEGL
ncbi:hypothetical protein AB4Y36_22170 [Paraburkholderia sp. BR10936]|uniref:hypothetical protein n=1 Tax=Paraburkholderia sp. BR10936 TaxID=3236993 RepID=UPI0034D1BE03